jgi:hypothetical protein
MPRHSAHVLELAKRGAALRFQELVNELDLLLGLFPDLRDAFDADELPVSFIVKRDARRTAADAAGQQTRMAAAERRAVSRRKRRGWADRRAGVKR